MFKIACLLSLFFCSFSLRVHAQNLPVATIDEVAWSAGQPRQSAAWSLPETIKQSKDFSVALWVRLTGKGDDYTSLAANKTWDDSEVVDLLSSSNMGITLASGKNLGWVLATQPNGSWLWNIGNGKNRLDYLPTAQRQPILDDRWHLLSFCNDHDRKETRLFYDGLNVAIYSTGGFDDLQTDQPAVVGGDRLKGNTATDVGGRLANARYWNRKLSAAEMFATYQERYPDSRLAPRQESVAELKVLSWNIWHGARHPGTEKGIQQAVDLIRHSGADVITMQETYGSGPTIADRLGYYFYLRSSNISILSRYPIVETHDVYESFRLGGATVRLSPTQQVNVFSLWIHYLPAWRRDTAAEGATPEALIAGEWTTRASEMRDILEKLRPFIEGADDTPLIVGGDFNSPSKLDWTNATANWHHGLVVDWPVSKQVLDTGFTDSYRQIHGDPLKHLPHAMWKGDASRLTYRIDYLYGLGKTIAPIESRMMNTHNDTWPSDHPAVLTSFRLKQQPLRVISYNILEGFRGKSSGRYPAGEKRRQLVSAWLSRQKVDVIAFQELNGYSEQRLQREAAAWGHSHAATLKEDGYIVGLTSKYPIDVVERRMTGMHHGMLHCRTAGVDCFVVHLSPFNFRHRQREVQLIAQRVKRALDVKRPVLVLGDFNSLSPADRTNYDNNQALLQRLREYDAKHDHVENLNQGKIDYSVMTTLLDLGLVDLYDRHRGDDAPTMRRIDFILASVDLAQRSTSAEWFVTKEHESMSDHFPVSADIHLPSQDQ